MFEGSADDRVLGKRGAFLAGRELASTLFNIPKDKLVLVPKGSAGRKR